MKKALFIAMHRPNRSPSQRFRFEQYFNHLQENGIHCELSYLISANDDSILYSQGNYIKKFIIFIKSWLHRVKDLYRAADFDYIFIQREAIMTGSTYFERRLAKRHKKIFFDFDDSIWLEDKSAANSSLSFLKNPAKTARILSLCHHIIAGNEYLAKYAKEYNSKVSIIPTTIDTVMYQPGNPTKSDQVIIGWSGSFSTIKHFEEAIPTLEMLKQKYGDKIRFMVIGDKSYTYKPLDIKGLGWNALTEVKDLQRIDIGIMPLPDDNWSNGKCGLKGLQYMALAIPTVMSAVGVNTEIIDDGVNGYLAASQDEWVNKLSLLIESSDLRHKIGLAGRATVEEKYSIEANKAKYLALFN